MGKHSSPEGWAFYRSAIAWFLPWALLAAVATTAVAVAIDALGQSEMQPPPAEVATPVPSPTPSPEVEETPEAIPSPEETEEEEEKEEREAKLITQGITVQVLNGTNSAGADDRMADRLARLGFEIIALNPARPRDQTTVFWAVPDAQEAARRLAARFGWQVGPKPDNLSSQVSIHVVVGADEA